MTTPSLLHSLSIATRLLGTTCSAALGTSLVAAPGCAAHEGPAYVFELASDPQSLSVRAHALATAGDVEPIAVGRGGSIAQRVENLWAARDSGVAADLHAVALDPTHAAQLALAVGDAGALVRSVDGGARWSALELGVDTDLRAVALGRVEAAADAWALAAGGAEIFRSIDSGATWTAIAHDSDELAALAAAIDVTGTRALVVGRRGVALLSQDGGATWSRLSLPTAADLTVAIAGVEGGFHVGSADGEVLRIDADLEVCALASAGDAPVRGLADADDGLWIVRDDRIELRFTDGDTHTAALAGPATAAALDHLRGLVVAGEVPSGWSLRGRYVAQERRACAEAVARPRRVGARLRAGWGAAPGPDLALSGLVRARLADAWASDGRFERASVAALARFVLQLLAVGAPPELVRDARAALSGEVHLVALRLALADAGRGSLGSLMDPVVKDLSRAAASCARESCVRQTIAAVQARTAAGLARDPAVARALARIAEDGSRQAALGWRFVAWALRTGGPEVRAAVARAFAEELPAGQVGVAFAGLEGRGRPGPLASDGLARRAARDIIAPLAHKLFHASGEPIAARPEESPCSSPS